MLGQRRSFVIELTTAPPNSLVIACVRYNDLKLIAD